MSSLRQRIGHAHTVGCQMMARASIAGRSSTSRLGVALLERTTEVALGLTVAVLILIAMVWDFLWLLRGLPITNRSEDDVNEEVQQ